VTCTTMRVLENATVDRDNGVVIDSATEDLLRKAAPHQWRRRFVAGCVALLAATTANVLWPASTPPRPTGLALPAANFPAGPFAGTWRLHTFTITIRSDGTGSVAWPTHVPCPESKAISTAIACDQFTPATIVVEGAPVQVVNVSEGGKAKIQLIWVNRTNAVAIISDSTVPSTLPDGQAALNVTTQDLLYVTPSSPTPGSPFGRSGFCGPSALALGLQQQDAQGINCGA
jgi:hypothetical protein